MIPKQTNEFEIREIEIPVPWGHVAGKCWGSDLNTPVLCFHGMQDNAGSFDRLIPYLPKNLHYICIDLPGHGKSSHFPQGLPIYTIFYVMTYKIVVDYLKTEILPKAHRNSKFYIIGHSLGGQCAVLFTQLYPQIVSKLAILDTLHLFPQSAQSTVSFWRGRFKFHSLWSSKLLEKKQPPSYSYSEAFKKLKSARAWSDISDEAAEVLLKRAVAPDGNGKYRFTTDQRLKAFINPAMDMNFLLDLCRKYPVHCPFLIILAKSGFGQYSVYFEPVLKEYKKNKMCKIEWVLGGHDVHNVDPHIVAKTWGKSTNCPVLCLHGLQDNAGTFDRLIPHLPQNFYYICIDLPSHGFSSYYPEGVPIENMNHVLTLKIVADELKYTEFILMGHSLGGQISILFTQLYPIQVKKLIILDTAYFNPQRMTGLAENWIYKIGQHIDWTKKSAKKSQPSYTYEEALKRIIESRSVGLITEEAAKALMTRSVKKLDNGRYVFTADQRLKFYFSPPFDVKFIVEFLRRDPICCPMLLILAKGGIGQYYAYIKPIIETYKKKNKAPFILKQVEGNHDVHNVDPLTISPIISNFLTKSNFKSKL